MFGQGPWRKASCKTNEVLNGLALFGLKIACALEFTAHRHTLCIGGNHNNVAIAQLHIALIRTVEHEVVDV